MTEGLIAYEAQLREDARGAYHRAHLSYVIQRSQGAEIEPPVLPPILDA